MPWRQAKLAPEVCGVSQSAAHEALSVCLDSYFIDKSGNGLQPH